VTKYFQNFKDIHSVREAFNIPQEALLAKEVLFAWYGYGSYSGNAVVLFLREGKLYEVTAGHCSCYGIEDQWKPCEVSWEQLAMRESAIDQQYFDDDNGLATEAYLQLVRRHAPRA